MEINGVLTSWSCGAAALGDPAACVAWLANAIARLRRPARGRRDRAVRRPRQVRPRASRRRRPGGLRPPRPRQRPLRVTTSRMTQERMTLTSEGLTYESTSRTAKAGDLDAPLPRGGDGRTARPPPRRRARRLGLEQLEAEPRSPGRALPGAAVDQPGYGRSDKPVIKGGMWEFYARAVRGLLDELGIEKTHFIGNSLGGGTTLKFALDYPERTDRLVLMGPAGGMLPHHQLLAVGGPQDPDGLLRPARPEPGEDAGDHRSADVQPRQGRPRRARGALPGGHRPRRHGHRHGRVQGGAVRRAGAGGRGAVARRAPDHQPHAAHLGSRRPGAAARLARCS